MAAAAAAVAVTAALAALEPEANDASPLLLPPFSFSTEADRPDEAEGGGGGGREGGGGISASGALGGFNTVSLAGVSLTLSLAAAEARISEAGTRAASTRAPGGSRPKSRPCLCLAQSECRFLCIWLVFVDDEEEEGGGGGGP